MEASNETHNLNQAKNRGPADIAGSLARSFITSPLTLLILLAAMAVGIMAILAIPREEEPQISVPMVDVMIPAPGLNAQDVSRVITIPVEHVLAGLNGVEHVYSRSQDDGVMLTARFKVGTDPDAAIVRVQQKLREPSARPPAMRQEPIITLKGIDDVPILAITISPKPEAVDRWDNGSLYRLANDMLKELNQVPEIGTSFIVGGQPQEIQIAPNIAAMTSHNVSLSAISAAIAGYSNGAEIGTIAANGASNALSIGQPFSSEAEIGQRLVTNASGQSVRLIDVANISMAPADIGVRAWHFAHQKDQLQQDQFSPVPAVTIAVAKRAGANAVKVSEGLHEKIAAMNQHLVPDSVNVTIVRDYGETANEKANELLLHLGLATLSIVALIYFAIGKKEALVTLVVIPTTILLTLFAANLMGYTINRVSLFALIFSIGILVDDAIVIIENIARHWAMDDGRSKKDAAIAAVSEVGNPTIIATMTVVVALLPMMFVSGLMGPYMAPIPANASAAMIFSFFVAVVIAPWLMLKLNAKAEKSGKAHAHHDEGLLGRLYRKVAGPIIAERKKSTLLLTIVGVATLASMAAFGLKLVPVKLLPFDNKSELQLVLDMPEGASVEQTQRVLFEVAHLAAAMPEIANMQLYAGTAAPFNFNGLVRHYYARSGPEMGDLQINFAPRKDRKRSSHQLTLALREMLKNVPLPEGASLKFVEVPPGPPVLATLLAEVYGPDAQTRRQVARQLAAELGKISYVVDIDNSFGNPRPHFSIVPNHAHLETLGLEEATLNAALVPIFSGQALGYVQARTGQDPLPIMLRLPAGQRNWDNGLAALPIGVTSDEVGGTRLVALSEIGQPTEIAGSYPIFRRDGHDAEMVTAELAGRYEAPIYGILDANMRIKSLKDPTGQPIAVRLNGQPNNESGTTILWDGEWEITWVTFRDMGAAFGVALIGIYILVVGQFKSFKVPLVVLTPIPLTLIGIVIGHILFGAPFTATSMIGFIALAGIIVRNSILLIDFIRHAQSNPLAPARPLKEILLDAGAIRFKPIVLTAAAAMIGAVVILGDPIFQGLAISLLFGLMSSTLLTVLVIPAIYVVLRTKDDPKFADEMDAPATL